MVRPIAFVLIRAVAVALAAAAPCAAQTSAPLSLSEVLRQTLAASPDVRLAQQQTDVDKGSGVSASTPFDFRVSSALKSDNSSLSTPLPTERSLSTETSTVTSAVSLDKLFRSGISVSASLGLNRLDTTTLAGLPANQSTASISGIVPLAGGRGGGFAAGLERAAARTVDASELTLEHTAARAVLAAARAYWSYRAAYLQLDVHRGSLARAERLVEETQLLIAADERAPSDLDLMRANLATKRASLPAAEQFVMQAQAEVVAATGAPAGSLPTLGAPDTPLPRPSSAPVLAAGALVQQAQASRRDLAAAVARVDSARAAATGARQDLRPRVDLVLGFGYAGMTRGNAFSQYLSPLVSDIAGLNTAFQIRYQPVSLNSSIRGNVLQSEARVLQAEVSADDLGRRIATQTQVAVAGLDRAAGALAHTAEAVRMARLVIETEQQKFRLGVTTIFDAILAEDTLTNALLGEIAAQLAYAQALAQLRFETGAITTQAGGRTAADVDGLLTAPAAKGAR